MGPVKRRALHGGGREFAGGGAGSAGGEHGFLRGRAERPGERGIPAGTERRERGGDHGEESVAGGATERMRESSNGGGVVGG